MLRSKEIGDRTLSAPRRLMLFLVICERRPFTLQIKIQTFDVGESTCYIFSRSLSVWKTPLDIVSPCSCGFVNHFILRLLSLLSFAIRSVPVSLPCFMFNESFSPMQRALRLILTGYQHDTNVHEGRYDLRTIGTFPSFPSPFSLDTKHQ